MKLKAKTGHNTAAISTEHFGRFLINPSKVRAGHVFNGSVLFLFPFLGNHLQSVCRKHPLSLVF